MRDHSLGQQSRDDRLERIASELRHRMRPVCPDMPDERFLDMVERMAAIQLKYELREQRSAD